MSSVGRSTAEVIVRSRHLGLEPGKTESAQAFALRVLDALSEEVVGLVTGRLTDRAEVLRRGAAPHSEARALRWALTDADALMKDLSALLTVIPDEEERL